MILYGPAGTSSVSCVPTLTDGVKTFPLPVSIRTVTLSPALIFNGGKTPAQNTSVGGVGVGIGEEDAIAAEGPCSADPLPLPPTVQPVMRPMSRTAASPWTYAEVTSRLGTSA